MSNPDSFIDEVSEEVRRDRLYGFFRRWAWVGVLLVVVVVGGAAFTEWRRAQAEARAEAFGAAVLAALALSDASAREAALDAVAPATPEQGTILALLEGAQALEAAAEGDRAAVVALVDAAEAASEVGPIYADLAILKAMLAGGTGDAARDAALLEGLALPGRPFRVLAVEQQALRALEAGDEGTALTLLRLLSEDAEATDALRRRALQLIVALGASPEPA
jgi:hypothetical protein